MHLTTCRSLSFAFRRSPANELGLTIASRRHVLQCFAKNKTKNKQKRGTEGSFLRKVGSKNSTSYKVKPYKLDYTECIPFEINTPCKYDIRKEKRSMMSLGHRPPVFESPLGNKKHVKIAHMMQLSRSNVVDLGFSLYNLNFFRLSEIELEYWLNQCLQALAPFREVRWKALDCLWKVVRRIGTAFKRLTNRKIHVTPPLGRRRLFLLAEVGKTLLNNIFTAELD